MVNNSLVPNGSNFEVVGGYVTVVGRVTDSLLACSSSFLPKISLMEDLGAQHFVPGFLHLNKSDISAFPEKVYFCHS